MGEEMVGIAKSDGTIVSVPWLLVLNAVACRLLEKVSQGARSQDVEVLIVGEMLNFLDGRKVTISVKAERGEATDG